MMHRQILKKTHYPLSCQKNYDIRKIAESHIQKIDKEFLEFGDVEIEKQNLIAPQQSININNGDAEKYWYLMTFPEIKTKKEMQNVLSYKRKVRKLHH